MRKLLDYALYAFTAKGIAPLLIVEIDGFTCTTLNIDAVRAALTTKQSNGQTEGKVNKLKCIKRIVS